jgi:hypothetical protein
MTTNKSTTKSAKRAALVRKLVAATGMTRFGVYRAMREKRGPHNTLVRQAWDRVMSKSRGTKAPAKALAS